MLLQEARANISFLILHSSTVVSAFIWHPTHESGPSVSRPRGKYCSRPLSCWLLYFRADDIRDPSHNSRADVSTASEIARGGW